MKRIFFLLLLVATALAAPTSPVVDPSSGASDEPLVKPMPVPAAAAAAASPKPAKATTAAVASPPAPAPKAAAPSSFVAYTLSAAQATLTADPSVSGLATLILGGVSNTTIPRGSAGVLSGPLHTPTFLATLFPSGSTVELRGSPAAGGGGDWGSAYLRKASLVASGPADGVVVITGAVVPASLGDAGAATFGTRGALTFNKVSVLVTAPPKKREGNAAAQKLTSPSPAPAAAAPRDETTATDAPKVSVAASTRPAAASVTTAKQSPASAVAKSIPMPREFSN